MFACWFPSFLDASPSVHSLLHVFMLLNFTLEILPLFGTRALCHSYTGMNEWLDGKHYGQHSSQGNWLRQTDRRTSRRAAMTAAITYLHWLPFRFPPFGHLACVSDFECLFSHNTTIVVCASNSSSTKHHGAKEHFSWTQCIFLDYSINWFS